MVVFSHSRLSTFEQCKLKYKFRYVDNIIPDIEKTIESQLGSVVHKTLEWLYKQVKYKKANVPSLDELIKKYAEDWREDFEDGIPIAKKNLTPEHYFNKGIQFLVNYYFEHKPFDDNTIAVEKEIMVNLDDSGEYRIRGFIDRLVYNLETGEYEIHDYKTSNSMPKREDIEKDRQLAFYSIAIKKMFGEEKKIILVWHYLSFNKRIHSRRTDEQLSQLKGETIRLIKDIESTKEFPPTKSALCNWCEYKSICPAWGNKPPEKQITLEEYYELNGEKKNHNNSYK